MLALMLYDIAHLQISKFAEVLRPKRVIFLLYVLQLAAISSIGRKILTAES